MTFFKGDGLSTMFGVTDQDRQRWAQMRGDDHQRDVAQARTRQTARQMSSRSMGDAMRLADMQINARMHALQEQLVSKNDEKDVVDVDTVTTTTRRHRLTGAEARAEMRRVDEEKKKERGFNYDFC